MFIQRISYIAISLIPTASAGQAGSWDEFENDGWDFGLDEINQDCVVEIDRCGPWNISGTKWNNKILTVETPPNNGRGRFLNEVARGNTLYLRNDRAWKSPVFRYAARPRHMASIAPASAVYSVVSTAMIPSINSPRIHNKAPA